MLTTSGLAFMWVLLALPPIQNGWPPIPEPLLPHPGMTLLKPEFKGQVMVAHPSTSGTSYTALATVLQMRGEEAGWEYLKKYAGQMAQFTKSGAAPAKFVGQGEAAVAIVFSHDIVNEIENNKLPLELTFPAEGTGYRNWRYGHHERRQEHSGCQTLVRLGIDP